MADRSPGEGPARDRDAGAEAPAGRDGGAPGFSHLDDAGRARMVDVGGKEPTRRRAVAEGWIRMQPDTLAAIRRQEVEKGDVLTVARLAAVGGAKRTADVVPLCHPIPLDAVDVRLEAEDDPPRMRIEVTVTTEAKTGVEMEALCAAATGLLAVYDMCKGMDRGMTVEAVRLVEKEGGRSGRWSR